MKTSPKTLALILLIIVISGCTVYREVPIEVLKPKTFTVPSGSAIGLVYRNFKYRGDTLQNYYRYDYELRKEKPEAEFNADSLVAMTALNRLASIFEAEQIASEVKILPYNSLPRIRGEHLAPLSEEVIRNLGSYTRTDRLIILETISAFYSRYTSQSEPGESADVIMAGIWALYNSQTGKLEKHVSMVDTLFWNGKDDQGKKLVIPPRLLALDLAAEVYTDNFSGKFKETWENVQRVVIVPPVQEFNLAGQYASENEWEKALEIWERFTPGRFGRLSVSARFNTALAWEMLNDIESALEWIGMAEKQTQIYRNKEEVNLVKSYQRVLENRKKEIDQLTRETNE